MKFRDNIDDALDAHNETCRLVIDVLNSQRQKYDVGNEIDMLITQSVVANLLLDLAEYNNLNLEELIAGYKETLDYVIKAVKEAREGYEQGVGNES